MHIITSLSIAAGAIVGAALLAQSSVAHAVGCNRQKPWSDTLPSGQFTSSVSQCADASANGAIEFLGSVAGTRSYQFTADLKKTIPPGGGQNRAFMSLLSSTGAAVLSSSADTDPLSGSGHRVRETKQLGVLANPVTMRLLAGDDTGS